MPRILFIVPADYDALTIKGVESMIYERDEGGFFQRVVTVHPIATKTRILELGGAHAIYELGFDIFGKMGRYRYGRLLVSPFHLIRVVWVTLGLVRSEQIDLIRANDPFWIGLVGMIVGKLSGRPWCVSIHSDFDKRLQLTGGGDTYTFFGFKWPARLVSRMVLSNASLVLPIRESLNKWAITNGAPPERIRVIPHGVDPQALASESDHDVRMMFGIPESQQILSFVGRLSPENYLHDLLLSVRKLMMRRNDFCLVIAGGGELDGWLRGELCADSRLASVVRVVGFQPRGVCFALRRMSLVSLCLMGGFSLVEACLASSPVIAYDVEWHSELVQTGTTGYLLDEGDIDGVVRSIDHCLNDSVTAARLGRHACKVALLAHDLTVTSGIKKKHYEELLSHG